MFGVTGRKNTRCFFKTIDSPFGNNLPAVSSVRKYPRSLAMERAILGNWTLTATGMVPSGVARWAKDASGERRLAFDGARGREEGEHVYK